MWNSVPFALSYHDSQKQDIDQLVIIKADVGVTHGRVVTVMDMVRGFGFTRMAIATDTEGEASLSGRSAHAVDFP